MADVYRILIIEDEEDLLFGLEMNFRSEGYQVITASDGATGIEKAEEALPDLITVDMMLPGKMDGLAVCRELRARGIQKPIIVISCRSEETRIVSALEIGADDYVTKPFRLHELFARVHAHLRRSEILQESCPRQGLNFGDIAIDFKRFEVTKNGRGVELTSKEFNLLKFLVQHRGELLTRDEILNEVWGYECYPTTRTVDNHILRLRKKLEEDPARPRMIQSIYGEGYRFIAAG